MSDLIDRQAAIDEVTFWKKRANEYEAMLCELMTKIAKGMTVDSVVINKDGILFKGSQPERKKGEWIKIPEFCGDDVSGFIDNHFSCSECKKEAEINPWGFYILSDFCPNCGADMRGEQR